MFLSELSVLVLVAGLLVVEGPQVAQSAPVPFMDMSQMNSLLAFVTPDMLCNMLGMTKEVAEKVCAILKEPGDIMSKVPKFMAVPGLDIGAIMAKAGGMSSMFGR